MPRFRTRALAENQVVTAIIEAEDEAAVLRALRRAGQRPLRVEPMGRWPTWPGLGRLGAGRVRTLEAEEVMHLTRELGTMLRAGQDLDRALRFVVETAPSARIRTVATDLREQVRQGSPLHAALGRHPGSFPALYLGLVRAGEAGGALGETLERLGELLERQRALARTVRAALVYPVLLLVAAIASVVLLVTQVLPQFAVMFEESGATMPALTRALLEGGRFVADWWMMALLALLLLLLLLRTQLRRPGPRRLADGLLLRLPIAGPLAREVLAARFARTLGSLLQNGMPLIGALGIVRDVMGNLAAVEAVEATIGSARRGGGLAVALHESGVFPPRLIHLLRLGEDTAQIGPLALRAAEILEGEIQLRAQRLVAMMVPVITVVMGGVIAALVGSLLLAMLSINELAG